MDVTELINRQLKQISDTLYSIRCTECPMYESCKVRTDTSICQIITDALEKYNGE